MTRHKTANGQTLFTFPKHKAPITVHDLDSDYAYPLYQVMSAGDSGSSEQVFFDGKCFPDKRDPYKEVRGVMESYDMSDLGYGWHTLTPEAWQVYDSDHSYKAPLLTANEYGGVDLSSYTGDEE